MLNSTAAALFTRTPWRGKIAPGNASKTKDISNVANAQVYEDTGDSHGLVDSDSNHRDSNSLGLNNGTKGLENPLSGSDCKIISACDAAWDVTDSPVSEKDTFPQLTLASRLVFLKNPKFYVVAYTFGQSWYLNTTLLTVVVDYAVDRGIPKWDAVSLVTFIAVADLVSRFVSGPITDKGLLRKSAMMVLCLTAHGVAYSLLPLASSYPALAALSAVAGSCVGITVTHIFVLCGELVDPAVFSLCLGAANFLAAFALLERPLMIGKSAAQWPAFT
ncbi:hypothetical protein MTO96_033390 [Rhipicephalus appendiculatus]